MNALTETQMEKAAKLIGRSMEATLATYNTELAAKFGVTPLHIVGSEIVAHINLVAINVAELLVERDANQSERASRVNLLTDEILSAIGAVIRNQASRSSDSANDGTAPAAVQDHGGQRRLNSVATPKNR